VFATKEESMRRSMLAFSVLLAMAPQLAWADALGDGIELVGKGDYDRAVPVLMQAAEANPADPRPYLYLEKAYEGLYRLTEAIDAHERYLTLQEKAARPKPAAKATAGPDLLPPVYVKPGPRPKLPAITNDMIPKQPTVYKATPLDTPPPAAKAATGSDAAARGAAVAPPPLPAPSATPTPAPNLLPITESTGYNAPPVAPPPLPAPQQ
jgi:tetratricopeptide (TPR) repeat protein